MEFLILGPLEARIADEVVHLGGAKQRAVLAALLLRAGEVVPVARLIDEVWGDDPPQSAAGSIESYISRLRQLFNGHGPALVRRGAGYTLELGASTLDATGFEELLEEAGAAADGWEFERAAALGREALRAWRGPALADVVLSSTGRVEAERLEEQRLRACEVRFGAELELGRHWAIVGELHAAIGQNPYREKFVELLMLALYRSGRHAEALDAYEQLRRRLDDDLGLQPSLELQQLSGRIVRQDPELRRPTGSRPELPGQPGARLRVRRLAGLVAAGAMIAAAMALTARGGAAVPSAASAVSNRVVLVHPADPEYAGLPMQFGQTWRSWATSWRYEPELIAFDEAGTDSDVAERLRERVEDGRFALVVVAGDGAVARAVRPLVRRLPGTAFVFADASLADLSLRGAPNASAIRFKDEQSSELAGYATALAPPRHGPANERVGSVSIIAAGPTAHTRRVVRGFVRGLRHGSRTVRVAVDYVRETHDVTACERIANRRIDAGADVVFAVAGRCSQGAIAVARTRGVWAVGEMIDDPAIEPEPTMLTGTAKVWWQAFNRAVTDFHLGQLPFGRDEVLGLEDDYSVLVYLGTAGVPESVWSKVVAHCSELREAAARGA